MGKLTMGKMTKRKATKEDYERAEKQRQITEKHTGEKTEKISKKREEEKTERRKKGRRKIEKEPISLGPTIELEAPEKEKGVVSKVLETAGKVWEGKPITINGKEIKTGLGERIDVVAGTVPIGPGGFLSAGAGAVKGLDAITKASIKAGNLQQIKAVSGGIKTIALNAKNTALTTSLLSKVFSPKTLVTMGGAATSMFLGQWAQAEAPEPISIVMRDALKEAENTGNWELYNEAKEARTEITNLEMWEKILMWTPLSPLVGITNKIKGAITGGIVMDKLAEDKQIQQETGESNNDMWKRIREEEAAQDKASVDYYNEQRKQMLEWEAEAKRNQRNADAEFWRKEREAQRKKEEEDRKAIADFWIAYRKQMQKLADNSRPSNLNFGIL